MGYGRDVSRYNDGKRVVKDKDIGPLVSTDMTRCIHCTRCVRFGEEIQGKPQLGTIERGENVEISTYVEQNVDHELSANIIDLCPVGALNNKPYRYSARAWEMVQRATVSPHDCVGSNMYAHVLRGTVKRIVPRTTKRSTRPGFPIATVSATKPSTARSPADAAHQGKRRVARYRLGRGAGKRCRSAQGAADNGCICVAERDGRRRPSAVALATHLGTANIDHRIERRDFSDQDNDPVFPWLGCSIAELEDQDAILSSARTFARKRRSSRTDCARRRWRRERQFRKQREYEYFFDVDHLGRLVMRRRGAACRACARALARASDRDSDCEQLKKRTTRWCCWAILRHGTALLRPCVRWPRYRRADRCQARHLSPRRQSARREPGRRAAASTGCRRAQRLADARCSRSMHVCC